MFPSSEWHARLGPVDFSVGIRHFQLGRDFRERLPALPGSAGGEPRPAGPAPGGRIPAAEEGVAGREPEGGAAG
jgi:hypothetical protein